MKLTIKLPILAVLLGLYSFVLAQEPDDKTRELSELKSDLANKELPPADKAVIHRELAARLQSVGDKAWVGHRKEALKLVGAPVADNVKLAKELIEAHLYEESIEFIGEAREKFPESADLPWLLTHPLRNEGRFGEAVEAFKACENLATKSRPEFLDERFYFSFAVMVERTKDIDQAAELFKKTIKLIEKQNQEKEDKLFTAAVYNYLGYMWLDNDMKVAEAGELIKTAHDLDPESPAITDSLGWFYFKKGQFKEAKEWLLLSAELLEAEGSDPDPVILDHIAQAHFALDEQAKAIEYMQQAIALDPENKELAKLLKQFQNSGKPIE